MQRFLLALILSAVSSGVSAALISADWQTTGDNLITLDTVTGLQWLDLTETYGAQFSSVNTELEAGGQFAGFRYATDAEVINFWSNFGIDLSSGASTSAPGMN